MQIFTNDSASAFLASACFLFVQDDKRHTAAIMSKKVLLIRLSSLGVVIHTIPLANALKGAGYELTWLVSEKGVQVLEGNPCVDKVILAPVVKWKKRGFSLDSFKEYSEI